MGMFSKLFGAGKEKCFNHPQRDAVGYCVSCKRCFCENCLSEALGYYCDNEVCKSFVENARKHATHDTIAKGARSLANDIINIVDGGMTSNEAFNIVAIYIEIIFVCIHNLMDIASEYLDEQEKLTFTGEIYVGIRDILAKRYSGQNDIGEFQG